MERLYLHLHFERYMTIYTVTYICQSNNGVKIIIKVVAKIQTPFTPSFTPPSNPAQHT